MKPVYLYRLDFPNGKKYIGLSQNADRRFREHCRQAAAGKGGNAVHAAIRKHGPPLLRLLCAGDKQYIAALEIKAIEAFQTRDRRSGYNVSLGGQLAPTLVPEIAARAGLARRGLRFSAEHRARIATASTGRTHTAETRARLRVARLTQACPMTGRKLSPETRGKISRAAIGRSSPRKGIPTGRPGPNKGKSPSPETRAKLSAAGLGRKASPETRAKLSAARMGNTNAKGSKGSVGRIVSAETRAKMSVARRKRIISLPIEETIVLSRPTHLALSEN